MSYVTIETQTVFNSLLIKVTLVDGQKESLNYYKFTQKLLKKNISVYTYTVYD